MSVQLVKGVNLRRSTEKYKTVRALLVRFISIKSWYHYKRTLLSSLMEPEQLVQIKSS